MPLSRTWYTDMNLSFPNVTTGTLQSKSYLWCIKSLLMQDAAAVGTHGPDGAPIAGSAWTCVGSSDSVTAGLDAVDRWGSPFDGTKIVRATAGTAHSWIVLQSPAAMGPVYWCLDWSTTSDVSMTFVWSRTAFTGGSITARPTSSTEWVNSNVNFCTSNTTAARASRVTDANGNFYIFSHLNGTGLFENMLGFQTLIETQVGELAPTVSLYSFISGGRGTPSGPDFNAASGSLRGRTWNDVGDMGVNGCLIVPYTGGQNPNTNANYRVNSATGFWDTMPVYVADNNVASWAIRGRLPDVSWTFGNTTILPVGSVNPSAGNIQQVLCGNMFVPFSVAPLL